MRTGQNYEELPGGAGVSLILESTSQAGVGPRLHRHPYAETFIIRHKFATGPAGNEAVHLHASDRFVTERLE